MGHLLHRFRRERVALAASCLALLVTACGDDGLGPRTPTAPAAPTPVPTAQPAPLGFSGAVQILGTGPDGDCVADALHRRGPATFDLMVGLTRSPDGVWGGTFYSSEFLGGGGECVTGVVQTKSGKLVLDLYRYCDFSYSNWPFVEGCGPGETTMVARELRMPVPDGSQPATIRGEGSLTIDRYPPDSLAPLEIRALFDLRQIGQ